MEGGLPLMASYFNLVLDTTAPQAPTFVVNSNAAYSNTRSVTGNFSTSDAPTTGYQIKIWGDVDPAANASIQATEGASAFIPYNAAQAFTLSTGDGVKNLNARIMDDVGNVTAILTDSITLDTTLPVVTVGTPSVSKISKQAGKRTATVTFQADTVFDQYQVRAVPATSSLVTDGTLVPTTNGSTNTSGSAGGYPAVTNITTSIDGADLEAASPGDGTKVLKVFVRDPAGNWSV